MSCDSLLRIVEDTITKINDEEIKLTECPFYDDGDGGYGSHCNINDNKCRKESCPLGEVWYDIPIYHIEERHESRVEVYGK